MKLSTKWLVVKEHMKLRQHWLDRKFPLRTRLNGYFQMMMFVRADSIAEANSFLRTKTGNS